MSRKRPTTPVVEKKNIRFIPDIHGETVGLSLVTDDAIGRGLYIEQLGDVIDHGPDSAGSLIKMLDIKAAGQGDMLLANHEYKHFRGFRNKKAYGDYRVEYRAEQLAARAQIEAVPGLVDRFLAASETMMFWKRIDEKLFIVHASYHEEMETIRAHGRMDQLLLSRAIYGQTSGKSDMYGMPERLTTWIGDVKAGQTVIVGHHIMSTEYITRYTNRAGGKVIYLDTGCGKHHDMPVFIDYIDGELVTDSPIVDLDHYG